MIRPILQLGNKNLRKKSLPIQDFDSQELESLVEDLFDTLHDAQTRFSYGRGIAAPQIGELKRVIVIDMPSFKSVLINPVTLQSSDSKFQVWDSCFSFNLAFFVLVDRHCSLMIECFDQKGRKHILNADGALSELLQHEIDHLDGVLAIDRMKKKQIIMRSEWEKAFKPDDQ